MLKILYFYIMKTKNYLLCLFLVVFLIKNKSAQGQHYVTIPDPVFVSWLQIFYPNCMNGNQMDTTCSDIVNAVSVSFSNTPSITNIDGIQYFDNLQNLDCANRHLTFLPELPKFLKTLDCSGNDLAVLPVLPSTLTSLDCSGNNLAVLPALPVGLRYLDFDHNDLTLLPSLPDSLEELYGKYNDLTELPVLPNSLKKIYCEYNQITSLHPLPLSLKELYIMSNLLTSLPTLPPAIEHINVVGNQLTALPTLPASLKYLFCTANPLGSLPALPNALLGLGCNQNQLTILPALPASLKNLDCNSNQLTVLPDISGTSLTHLSCVQNLLTFIPVLPNSLQDLRFTSNQVSSLPSLPPSLNRLFCGNNNISCFPVFSDSNNWEYLVLTPNPFTCLPNYISAMTSQLMNYPLCQDADIVNNPHACESMSGISGHTYNDQNVNCSYDNTEPGIAHIPVKLYDSNNNLIAQSTSFSNSIYNFVQAAGTYKVAIDTTGKPYTLSCVTAGVDTIVVTTNGNALATDVNFGLKCKPGTDIGVQSVFTQGFVFPGQLHTLNVVAGAMGYWYNLNCGAGISGQVVVHIQGPVTYVGPANGALTPTVSGNMYTYNIPDFGNINNTDAFNMVFTTNTNAQSGNDICVDIAVSPTAADNNTDNNYYQYCYTVVNSMDPNMKEVFPQSVLPGYDDYFIYTIHFQNTGTAPAFNIMLVDTLSTLLNTETFELLNYSHTNMVMLKDRVLTFRFPNIMLPDSTTNEPASKGFVQFKIKPIEILYTGINVENKAEIYFDYNAPVVTNTAVTKFEYITGTDGMPGSEHLNIFPNPVGEKAYLYYKASCSQTIKITIFNVIGQEIRSFNISADAGLNTIPINTQELISGVYMLMVNEGKSGSGKIKFVK